MLVTGLPSIVAGMVIAPDAFPSQPVMVTALSFTWYFKPVMVTALSFTSYFELGLTGFSSFVGSFTEDFALRNS